MDDEHKNRKQERKVRQEDQQVEKEELQRLKSTKIPRAGKVRKKDCNSSINEVFTAKSTILTHPKKVETWIPFDQSKCVEEENQFRSTNEKTLDDFTAFSRNLNEERPRRILSIQDTSSLRGDVGISNNKDVPESKSSRFRIINPHDLQNVSAK